MTQQAYTPEKIRDRIRPVMQRHDVDRAVLFGSYARGTSDERSDLDLMIVMQTAKRFLDRMAEFDELYDVLPGTAIDLLVYSPAELQSIGHRPFIRTILAEGVSLYER